MTETKSSILKSDDSEIVKMKNEIQSSLSEINSIRYEMKDSFKFRTPIISEEVEELKKKEQNNKQNIEEGKDHLNPIINNQNVIETTDTKEIKKDEISSFSKLYKTENENIFKSKDILSKEKEKKIQFPFSSMNFEAPIIKQLYDENSTFTDKIGGGADILSKNILEKKFSEIMKEKK